MSGRPEPVLVVNPRWDEGFVARVHSLVLDAESPRDLERELRGAYPNVLVRSRDLEGEHRVVWYVYREGRWIPPAAGPEEGAQ